MIREVVLTRYRWHVYACDIKLRVREVDGENMQPGEKRRRSRALFWAELCYSVVSSTVLVVASPIDAGGYKSIGGHTQPCWHACSWNPVCVDIC